MKKEFNIWAIFGIIIGILSFIYWFSVIGIIVNAIALIQISKNKQRGKIIAIIGIVLSLIFLLLRVSGIFSFDL